MLPFDDFALSRVTQIAVTVEELDRAVAFYRDALRLPLILQAPRLALFDCAGMRLMLSLPEGDFRRHASVLYFETADLDLGCTALKDRGVEFLTEPHKIAELGGKELWMAFFYDSERNPMALVSERPLEAAA